MKILNSDRNDGYAKIRIENEDDLWHLKDFFSKGDQVKALTQRTKLDGREKKTLTLTLEVEKVEYKDDRLRVTGEITKADDEVELGYHTFNLTPEDEFEIWKDEVSREEWESLEEAESKESYNVLFCLVEKGEADLYLVKESGISDLSNVSENIPGKMYESGDEAGKFQRELVEVLERSAKEVDSLILAGPGFEKEKIHDQISADLKEKTFTQDTSVTGKTGLHEAIKRGALKKVVKSSRIDEETDILEQFFEELEKDGKATYGLEKVEELGEQGAVETLIITQKQFREHQDLVKTVERNGGEVKKVHTDHEAGERLDNFGGVAALLRYKPN